MTYNLSMNYFAIRINEIRDRLISINLHEAVKAIIIPLIKANMLSTIVPTKVYF